MTKEEKLARLKSLQAEVDKIRQELGINPPGKAIFTAGGDASGNSVILVESDGFGAATTSVIEGHYPIDYVTKLERAFPTEQEAETAAEAVAFQGLSPWAVLGETV